MTESPDDRIHTRWPSRKTALLVPPAALGLYALMWVAIPGFGERTQRSLAALGLYELRYEPGVREPIRENGRRYLWGGPDEASRFDITEFSLDARRLHYGLGREYFKALVAPEFVRADEVPAPRTDRVRFARPMGQDDDDVFSASRGVLWPGEAARVLTVRVADEVRVYPLQLLKRHEVVNDVVGGRPIFVAYCSLADLAAVYDRQFGDHTLTFAVSGYTYYDPDVWDGRDAFLLWDRETESLWWPPLGTAVTPPLMDTQLKVLDETHWSQTTWGEARTRHPDALVLRAGQTFEPPADWPGLEPAAAVSIRSERADRSVAPRWGENTP